MSFFDNDWYMVQWYEDPRVVKLQILYSYLLHLYPGFYSYTEGATCKILDLLTETLLI